MGSVLQFVPRIRGRQLNELVKGVYITDRDGRLAYAYTAIWQLDAGGRICWQARIHRNGALKGQPTGSFAQKLGMAIKDCVRALVEDEIEKLPAVSS